MRIVTAFESDWCAFMCNELRKKGYQPPVTKDVEEMAICYFNAKRRWIETRPRTVSKSDVFVCPAEHADGLKQFIGVVEAGSDVNPYGSRKFRKADFADALLNDWNIHHFHFLVGGTKELLFAWVDSEAVRLINVGDHEGWTDIDLLEIVHRNWPEVLESARTKGLAGTNLTADQRKALRRNRLNAIVQFGDDCYCAIGGGLTGSGHSLRVAMSADYARAWIRGLEDAIRGSQIEIERSIVDQRKECQSEIHLTLEFAGDTAVAADEASGIRVALTTPPGTVSNLTSW